MSLKGEGRKKYKGRKVRGRQKRNIFFMWQMASFYVRVMSSAFVRGGMVGWRTHGGVYRAGDKYKLKQLSKSH